MKSSDLIKLNFAKNDDGEYVDPVTFKVFTDNTHIVAVKNTGNVFAWDTVERLNIKGKNWKDLVTDEDFTRQDIITLQDPQNVASRDLSQFKYLQDGTSTLTPEQEAERGAGIKGENLGSAAKILKAKDAVAKRREEREKAASGSATATEQQALANARKAAGQVSSKQRTTKPAPYNAAQHTSGAAAASFTSTGLTPSTQNERAILSDEEYMLKPKRVKQTGFVGLRTTHGSINIALYPEFAPKAVWNFITLAKKGAYNGVPFHRNIRNFMLQGGDPTGTGRGGQSCWGKPFADELEGPQKHDGRGVLSMANKGKDTNTSQFFLTYRATPHLDRKHTIFGRAMEGLETLGRLEAVPVDEKDRPLERCEIEELLVFVNPFEEFLKERSEEEAAEARKEALRREGGAEDERTTWTGKRIRADGKVEETGSGGGVGKYLRQAAEQAKDTEDEIVGEWEEPVPEPPNKKRKGGGGFGNFDAW